MKKLELWLYVIGTVIIIKALFRAEIADGFLIILIGVACILSAYCIGKSARRD